MSQEKLKVLEMLEKGSISAEEALRLIELLQKGDDIETGEADSKSEDTVKEEKIKDKEEHKSEDEDKDDGFFIDLNWLNDLKNNIVDSAINVSRYVGSQTSSAFGFGRPNQFYSTECNNVDVIKSIKIIGKNDRVELFGHKENSIKVEARYKLKRDSDFRIEFEGEDGAYKLNYDYNAVHSMGLAIKVPEAQIPYLSVDNKNGEIIIRHVNADKADIVTKNANVEIDAMICNDLAAETKNAHIYVYDIDVSKISLQTSNAPIHLKTANADFAKLITSNAPINLDGIDIREIYAKSSNAGMIFRNLYRDVSKEYSAYNLEAYTTNGDLTIELPKASDILCKLNASTTLGHIHTNIDDLEYLENSKDFLKAKSRNYDYANRRININLQTTNSNIDIRSIG